MHIKWIIAIIATLCWFIYLYRMWTKRDSHDSVMAPMFDTLIGIVKFLLSAFVYALFWIVWLIIF